jgi:hypothetical protein
MAGRVGIVRRVKRVKRVGILNRVKRVECFLGLWSS